MNQSPELPRMSFNGIELPGFCSLDAAPLNCPATPPATFHFEVKMIQSDWHSKETDKKPV